MVFDIRGPVAPVFTPFDESGNIDYKVIQEYMNHLNLHGVKGLVVGGTTGEAMSLTVGERKAVLEAWLEVAEPLEVKVIAQVGGAPLPDVLQLAKHAERAKVDAIMTLPELYYKPKTVDQLVGYLETVSDAASSLPLVYYHFPMMTGVDRLGNSAFGLFLIVIPPSEIGTVDHLVNMSQLFKRASAQIPNFKGMKADLGVAVQVADQLDEDHRVFIANHHIAPAVLMGHDSSIATVTNIFPELVHSVTEAVKSGDVMMARTEQETLNKLVDVIAAHGDFVPFMKAAMELVSGIQMGHPRPPLSRLEETSREYLEDNLRNLGVQIAF